MVAFGSVQGDISALSCPLGSNDSETTVSSDYGSVSSLTTPVDKNDGFASVPVLSVLVLLFSILSVSFASDDHSCILSATVSTIVWVCAVFMNRGRGVAWFLYKLLGLFLIGFGIGVGVHVHSVLPPVGTNPYNHVGLAFCTSLGLLIWWLIVVICALLSECGAGIVGSSAQFANETGWGWHTHEANLMRYGSFRGIFGAPASKDHHFLLYVFGGHCYWSGEALNDYAFFLANNHTFLALFFCHPQHPYSRTERLVVFLMVVCLTLFPVAAADTLLNPGPLLLLGVALCITLPRNIFKVYMREVMMADEAEAMLKGDDGVRKLLTERALDTEKFVTKCAACITTVISLGCVVLMWSVGQDIGQALVDCIHCLWFAFLIELLVELVWQWDGSCKVAYLGFFHRWFVERRMCCNRELMDVGPDMCQLTERAARPVASPGAESLMLISANWSMFTLYFNLSVVFYGNTIILDVLTIITILATNVVCLWILWLGHCNIQDTFFSTVSLHMLLGMIVAWHVADLLTLDDADTVPLICGAYLVFSTLLAGGRLAIWHILAWLLRSVGSLNQGLAKIL